MAESTKKLKCQVHNCTYISGRNNSDVNRHIQDMHSDNSHLCIVEDCHYYTNSEEHLVQHRREFHHDPKPWKCYVHNCNYITSKSSSLYTHMRSIHSDHSYPCTVEDCHYYTSNEDRIVRHRREFHHDPKPWKCNSCDYSTNQKLHYVGHIARHRLEKPFTCEKCGYASKNFFDLQNHKNRNSCWYTLSQAAQWENICHKIAKIKYKNKTWRWQPRIPTPDSDERQYIIPEAVVYDKSGNIETLIDAKRTNYAVQYKDIKIYPTVCKKIVFWSLIGISKHVTIQGTLVEFVSSSDLIEELKTFISTENMEQITTIIQQIQDLRQIKTNTSEKLEK